MSRKHKLSTKDEFLTKLVQNEIVRQEKEAEGEFSVGVGIFGTRDINLKNHGNFRKPGSQNFIPSGFRLTILHENIYFACCEKWPEKMDKLPPKYIIFVSNKFRF